jgi:hypothetical protein
VLSAIDAWPQRIETVDTVEVLTPGPIAKGSRVRLKQPRLPEGTVGRFYRKVTNQYLDLEAEGMKRAAESA